MSVEIISAKNSIPFSIKYESPLAKNRLCCSVLAVIALTGMAFLTCGIVILASKGNLIVNSEKSYLSPAISSIAAGAFLVLIGCAGIFAIWKWKVTPYAPSS